jgi:RNA-directed DNA polymerase
MKWEKWWEAGKKPMPKRFNHLYPIVCDFEHLLVSAKKARVGTGWTSETCEFFFKLEYNLLQLSDELAAGTYQPRLHRYFSIIDPKPRQIAVAPFRDRVVHHALVSVLMPIFEPVFIADSYATRVNKGTHAAVFCAQKMLKQWPYYLKTDVRKYFDNVQHAILLKLISRKIKDSKILLLVEKIILNGGNNGKGLPIGNLTSQFWANVYLDRLDHFVKQTLKVKAYVRYMDDMVLFANETKTLKRYHQALHEFLYDELGLTLHDKSTWMNHQVHGLSFLGMRIWPNYIRTRSVNWRRSQRKIQRRQKEWLLGRMDDEALQQCLASIVGYHQRYKKFHF